MKINPHKMEIAMANNGYNFIILSKESGVSRATLSYINGGKSCKPEIGGKIAKALKVSVEQLLEQEAQL